VPQLVVKLLILGLSNLVQRRVLPALKEIEGLEAIDIATRHGTTDWQRPDWLVGETFHDYDKGLEGSAAEIVYVSLVNSEHGRWARAALNAGRHVVVDKPAFLGLDNTQHAVDLAAKRDLCLAEATVWAYHPQIELMRRIFVESGSEPTRITLTFSVPPLNPDNFRYCRSLGGGSLWDQGPYAVSVGRVFFGAAPDTIDCHVLSSGGQDNIDTAFSMLATYPHARSVTGHFGFDTAYRNHLEILGEKVVVDADRAVTIAPDVENEIRVSAAEGTALRTAPASNPFQTFFANVFEAVKMRDWQKFRDDLLADARALQTLRDAAGVV
jgi:dTDP-3,4-didehydro-2,6-dideoxy-alpha-D-glucose 3-reductase